MKKFIIILSSVIILIGSVCFGLLFYNTHLSVEYRSNNFTFSIPKSFNYNSAKSNEGTSYTFRYLNELVHIDDLSLNCTPEVAQNFLTYHEDEENVHVEPFEGAKYKGYFRSSDLTIRGKKLVCLSYIFGTDTKYFSMDCSCGPLKAKLIRKTMEKIAESVVYSSDFSLADKPSKYDFGQVSIDAGSEFIYTDCTSDLKRSDSTGVLGVKGKHTEADDINKVYYPSVTIQVNKLTYSAAELADNEYDSLIAKQDKYALITREQKDMFGFTCERVYYESASKNNEGDQRCCDQYYFNDDEYIYFVSITYRKNADASDAEKMLGGITFKKADK